LTVDTNTASQREEEAMGKTAYVDQDECISCGLCIANLPAVFRFADNGKAEVHDPEGAPEEAIQQEAVDICPVSCIRWQE
jgi:ferredoxin